MDHGLAARMNVDVLNRYLLLAFAAMAVEGFEQRRIGARQFVGLREILAPTLEGLIADHGAAVAFHRRIVGSDQLCRHHAFQFVLRPDAD
jgi:hypothetical protein